MIAYGNLEGRYFTQWRIDDLIDLWLRLNEPTPLAKDCLIWYDADEDYHMLEFFVDGRHVKIRFYKVYTTLIDGETFRQACPRYYLQNMIFGIRGRFIKFTRPK